MAKDQSEPQANEAEQSDATVSAVGESSDATVAEAPAAPEAPVAPADEADVVAREQAAAEQEEAARATLAKAEEVLARAESAAAKAEAITGDDVGAKLQASRKEKADVVKFQIAEAYPNEELGELVPFTPKHTLTNIANGHTIVFEEGVPYEVPAALAEDLQRRDTEYGDYKENLHIKEEKFVNAGTISAGGK